MCIGVCMYVGVYVCVMCVCMYVYRRGCVYVYVCVALFMRVYVCVYIYVCMYGWIVGIVVCMCIYNASLIAGMYYCMYVCLHAYL